MASSPKNRSERKRGGVLAAFLVFAGFIAIGILSLGEVFSGVMAGGVAFVVHRQFIVRTWLLSDHVRGVALSGAGKHTEALAAFRRSEAAWNRRALLDRWRAPLLASAARWGFAEQARYNQAHCLYHLGRNEEATQILEALIAKEPALGMARALLEHLQARARDEGPVQAWDTLAADLGDAPS